MVGVSSTEGGEERGDVFLGRVLESLHALSG
jgi:hypothetical protein